MQEAFSLRKSAIKTTNAPVKLVYRFGGAIGLPFSDLIALQQFRTQRKLTEIPDNVIAYIREVEFRIDHIRAYEGSPQQVATALNSLKTKDRTCGAIGSPLSALVIQKVYVGRVQSYARLDDSIGLTLGNIWKSKLQKSIRDSYDGLNVIFAVETKPLWSYRM